MGDVFVFVLERMESCKDLYDFISERDALPECMAKSFFRQVVEAIIQCHRAGVIHRDIKVNISQEFAAVVVVVKRILIALIGGCFN